MEGPTTVKPPGVNKDMGSGQGRQRGGELTQETAEDVGMRCGAQRQVAEAGR